VCRRLSPSARYDRLTLSGEVNRMIAAALNEIKCRIRLLELSDRAAPNAGRGSRVELSRTAFWRCNRVRGGAAGLRG
jgi:hypothetical protein